MHFLSCLKRTKMKSAEIIKVYTSLVRPLMEYSCQLWHGGLTESQHNLLESIQERALRIAHPSLPYKEALDKSHLDSLVDRRDKLCNRLFQAAKHPNHKLHFLLPPERTVRLHTRNAYKYALPKVKTERYKNSFINYCLFKRW